ncbi:hypothetical protein KNU05_gp110 [Synechococcus virus S-PRM1]|uniref:Uncharacterized protein n=1 Tax=Synechococcus virus S-PRM1 TaxID=2100130 RepID=A0A346FKD9_9CAUD|nr:hypothetical protein KNU05_gp110 [Synechococcus virus S-PRM1]AXN58444.1 hypothetical protein [Synechococcus virus S-PRM1]
MHGNLEPEENIWGDEGLMDQVNRVINTLEWTGEDNIVVEIGGTQVSGIDVGDNYNPKWSSPKGTRKYNKDAFIVIKNLSRTPFKSSEPNSELKAHHA